MIRVCTMYNLKSYHYSMKSPKGVVGCQKGSHGSHGHPITRSSNSAKSAKSTQLNARTTLARRSRYENCVLRYLSLKISTSILDTHRSRVGGGDSDIFEYFPRYFRTVAFTPPPQRQPSKCDRIMGKGWAYPYHTRWCYHA